jgi:hypothetical protein
MSWMIRILYLILHLSQFHLVDGRKIVLHTVTHHSSFTAELLRVRATLC